jgi:hypothetical protein
VWFRFAESIYQFNPLGPALRSVTTTSNPVPLIWATLLQHSPPFPPHTLLSARRAEGDVASASLSSMIRNLRLHVLSWHAGKTMENVVHGNAAFARQSDLHAFR